MIFTSILILWHFEHKVDLKMPLGTELRRELISLTEVLNHFENLSDDDELSTGAGSADVTIFPPDDGASDDDSGDETCDNADVPPPKQLSAMTEIHTADVDEPDDKTDEKPSARRRRCILSKIKGISAVAWRDNNVVYTLSNEHVVQPVEYANRYSSKEKKSLQVTQPNVIHKYNKFMGRGGGVNLLHNNIPNSRISIRGKKLYIPNAFWLFDVCITNAWMLARSKELTIDQLSFRQQCVRTLLGKYGHVALCPGPMRYCDRASKLVRTSHGVHITSTDNRRRTCAHCRRNKTPVTCRKCNLPLHIHCFEDFHNKSCLYLNCLD
ncbi:hypothetical protein PR048_005787 [Dryococelus australis]|uniref:Phorbol-ester/DAG-type domain-containing protein n=1 Tax=Dryococelus australis TaxID=614101 RepID=A0ABQ9I972_9NEOP|nr:hypothetical protein PR048_005787 [Dryococelus australis]